jgi:HAD superfamily hydrolase (TIGR01509 family)
MTQRSCRFRAVIFDRDGTLFDSLDVILRSFNYGIEPFTDRRPANEEWFAAFGPAEPEVMAKFIGDEHRQQAFDRFYEYYQSHFHEIPLFPGIRELLSDLHEAGVGMAVFTGGGMESTRFCLREQKILSFFQELVTGDLVRNPKPDPEGVIRAIQSLRVEPQETLVVGDSGADIAAGHRAGAVTVLARWGRFAAPSDFPVPPDYTFQTVSELRQLLFRSES